MFLIPTLHNDVKVGNKIMIDDGKLEVNVIEITKDGDVKVAVTLGGILSSKKRGKPARYRNFVAGNDGKRHCRS